MESEMKLMRIFVVMSFLCSAGAAFAQTNCGWSNVPSVLWTNCGPVGIGTNNPQDKLQVNATSNGDGVTVTGVQTPGFKFLATPTSGGDRNWGIYTNYSVHGDLIFARSNDSTSSPYGGPVTMSLFDGKVGIGSTNPSSLMHIRHATESSPTSTAPAAYVGLRVERSADTNAAAMAIQGGSKATGGVGQIFLGNADEYDSVVLEGGSGKFNLSVRNAGGALTSALTVNSAGDLKVQGNIRAKYQDLAEWVPAGGELEAGTVVVLNRARLNEVTPSSSPYDTAVAGVVSGTPGVLLGEEGPDKAKIATTGRVKVKVDASKYAVAVGDLLVTSGRPGMAMVSQAVDVGGVRIHRPGTLIGKALEPLSAGEGEILVLLSLQ
jgi:hypothetical protein